MRRRRVLVCVAGAAALLGTGCARAVPGVAGAPTVAGSPTGAGSPSGAGSPTVAAGAVRASGLWGRAIAVPGLAALNTGRNAKVLSVSCASLGNCAAAGFYRNHGFQGFVVSEQNGRWGQAIEVPGLGALNMGQGADVLSVSCGSPGNCAVGGYYGNRGPDPYNVISGLGFVAVEKNGVWGQAIEVPGLAALNKGGNAEVSSVSCGSARDCAGAGFYTDGNGHQQGFVVSETNGVWGQAIEVPGLGALNKGGDPAVPVGVSSVSCASAGNCGAGGLYRGGSGDKHAFVVSEVNGTWGTAREVAASLGRDAAVDTVSCASAGNCAAGGYYGGKAFVISEVNGTWAAAQQVAGRLNIGDFGWVASVSCASAGNCSAGGAYDYGGYNAPFVISEKNGVWGQAIDVPGLVTRDAWISSVSCASAGNCGAGGGYDGAGSGAFVVGEKNGVWGNGIKAPPGPGGLSVVEVGSVSCASAGSCVAGGSYAQAGRHISIQGFVT